MFENNSVTSDFSEGVLETVKVNMKNTKHLSKVLCKTKLHRTHFDPTSTKDKSVYATYLKTGKWLSHFYTEWPSTNVPATIERKLITHILKDVE
jgi:hypothetical protein